MAESIEYIVEHDGDPMPYIIYRGSDESLARIILASVRPIGDWGVVLYQQFVGPREVLEVKR